MSRTPRTESGSLNILTVTLLTFGMFFMVTGPTVWVKVCGGIFWVLAVALFHDARTTRN